MSNPIPEKIPTKREPMVRARNACIFAQTIRSTTMTIPITATISTWVSCSLQGVFMSSVAARAASTVRSVPNRPKSFMVVPVPLNRRGRAAR